MNSEAANIGAGVNRPVSFWQRIGRKVKFMLSNKGALGIAGMEEDIATAALSAKQKRKGQVRKAQKGHRERQANYAKLLEQDIIDLRSLIATAEAEALLTQQENNAAREALLQAQIPIWCPRPDQNTELGQTVTFDTQGPVKPPPLSVNVRVLKAAPGSQAMQWIPSEGSMRVRTFFDEDLRKTILKVSPRDDISKRTDSGQGMEHFDAFLDNIPKVIESSEEDSTSLITKKNGQQQPPAQRQPTSKAAENQADFPTTAVNFILALEHPCRIHFHAPDPMFSSKTPETGHQLLGSTLLYTSAPPPVFPALSAAVPVPSFTHPSSALSTLETLKQMSNSLPKGDREITPVQAWFLLVNKYGIKFLMEEGRIERLRRALVGLVECFEFGAVMVESEFWEVVRRCLLDIALREEREGVREWI